MDLKRKKRMAKLILSKKFNVFLSFAVFGMLFLTFLFLLLKLKNSIWNTGLFV